jgi:hypothetical protein
MFLLVLQKAVVLNRASANQAALTGILSIVFPDLLSGTVTLVPSAVAGATHLLCLQL